MGSPIRVIWYTDPHNIWCWGFEPTVRRLEVLYPDKVEIETRQGGLFEDFSPVREQWARMSGGRWKDSVRTFFEAVSNQHRMPMNADAMLDSTDVQTEVANESGLNLDAFVQALDDGSANEAFQRDRDECQTLGISGFPTFVVRRDDETRHVDGWRPWDAFEEILRDVDPHLEAAPIKANDETALNLIQRYGMLATTELAAVLGTTDDDAEILLEELEGRDDVIRRPVGRGLMWELPTHRVGTSKADVTSRSS